MDPITGGLGLLLGLGKAIGGLLGSNSQRKLAAETARYSPWTHMTPGNIDTPSPVGDIASGALSGIATGQSIKNNDLFSSLLGKNLKSDDALSSYVPQTQLGFDTSNGLPGDFSNKMGSLWSLINGRK